MTVEGEGLEDAVYYPYALGTIPPGDLSPIGEASGDIGRLIVDARAYAIAGIDPQQYLAVAIDAAEYEAYVVELGDEEAYLPSTPPTHQILIGAQLDGDHPPEQLCRYFDPLADITPLSCQSPITVTVDGRTYRALGWSEGGKLASGFSFFSSDLEPIGALSDVDPRVESRQPLDRVAYAVRGIPAAEVIVLAIGSGIAVQHFVFAVDEAAIPAALCDYVGRYPVETTACGGRRNPAMIAMEESVIEYEDLWYMVEAIKYRFTIDVRCACPAESRGPFTVTVVGSDVVESVTDGTRAIALDDPRLSWTPLRVNEAFEQVIRYSPAEYFVVDYDPEYGIPLRFDADPTPTTAGDEYGFTITAFEILE